MISAFSCRRDLKQSHSMRTNRRPIAIMRRSCSDSPVTASQLDAVFGSDTFNYLVLLATLGKLGRTENEDATHILVREVYAMHQRGFHEQRIPAADQT